MTSAVIRMEFDGMKEWDGEKRESKVKFVAGLPFTPNHSPIFNAMFFGDFAEKNKEEIELKDISHEDFIGILHLIYPSHRSIWSSSVASLLGIADLYDIKYALNEVEEYLLKDDEMNIADKLLLADKYKLQALKHQCLYNLESIYECTDVMKTEEYAKLSDAAKIAMLDRINEIHDESMKLNCET
ncbi:hypothetical protein PFISCL1PPCAC_21186 [Pristionchus fissidentatus]|uniref:BTB domain-containing protein n=1 Tax=Pristionchus fissidentatus TaxID=1538716 RepID=A0AAV5WJC5_9BILA|nr:hypothetical protein PFISCL1PPCAC_21186 [Pristionchus fissidentatus]